ncbi:MAG: hypothetical protein GTN80_06125 [Nitrososphaeria archaeon]|nr:hypothetical protein [Nitrososphaeria archaeon]NIQ33202.1 hypothetical protein [Nitrososphaeria archaeon]
MSTNQLYLIHLASLELLEEVGVQIPIEEALKLCHEAGAEVDFNNQVVKMPSYLVEECIRKSPHRVTLYGRNAKYKLSVGDDKVYFGTVGIGTRILDPQTNEYKTLTSEHLAEMTRLADALENVDFYMIMGTPMDVPFEVGDRYQWMISFENTSKHVICQALDEKSTRDAIKMGSIVAGGEEELRKAPIMTFVICIPSPLFHDKGVSKALLEAARFGIPTLVESGPMAGATSPVTLAGTLAQNNAEVLSSLVLTKLVNPKSPMIYASWARSMDMKTCSAVFGSPEFALLQMCSTQLARYYNLPCSGGGLLCDAKISDAQAGYEKMLSALLPALGGRHLISGMGLVASETVPSYEQLVLDNEMVGMIKRVLRGVDFNDETLALDVIKKVGIAGNFMAEKHSLQHFSEELWMPKVTDRHVLDGWLKRGGMDVRQRAREVAISKLEEYEHTPLPKDVSNKIKKIVREAEKNLVKG